jgi:triacylglycerol lipase
MPNNLITLAMDGNISAPQESIRSPEGSEFSRANAMELANLTRIAYSDYENFESFDQDNALLEEGATINVDEKMEDDTIARYQILSPTLNTDPKDRGKYSYDVLGIFEYVSYTPFVFSLNPLKFLNFLREVRKPNISRFGFIAKREHEGEILIFVVFRGTREGFEWFNNSQVHQIGFLSEKGDDPEKNLMKVHWGFHKIYTKYRPGPFLRLRKWFKPPNAIFVGLSDFYIWLIDTIQTRLGNPEPSSYPSLKQVVERVIGGELEKYRREEKKSQVFVTGHSLGGALAVISTLHIDQEICKKKVFSSPILYSFASPRVGNQVFAREFPKNSYRIFNTEDLVANVPSSVLAVRGVEMTEGNYPFGRRIIDFFSGGLSNQVYEHVGIPVCFTYQTGAISSNHNMNVTYCSVLNSVR